MGSQVSSAVIFVCCELKSLGTNGEDVVDTPPVGFFVIMLEFCCDKCTKVTERHDIG